MARSMCGSGIISKGQVVIKKILSAVIAAVFAAALAIAASAEHKAVTAGDDPAGACGACWTQPLL